MKLIKSLSSQQDWSVNFIFDNMLEARYVRRTNDYFIVYLSSHNGCNKACRFCHLTQTGQTSFDSTEFEHYLLQAQTVLDYYKGKINQHGAAQKVNFNFMARGEPLANNVLVSNAPALFDALEEMTKELNLTVQFNISTIMPQEVKETCLEDIFKDCKQSHSIYYSLYSVNPDFRRRWLPKAIGVDDALIQIKNWQNRTKQQAAIHWAFIKGQNDSKQDIEQIIAKLDYYKINAKFNLVRYNPYSDAQGQESDETTLQENFNMLNEYLNNPSSRIVPRVGFDVKASCGMFIEKI